MNSNNISNQNPYLRTSRLFPDDINQLCIELNSAYIDIANSVNDRTIGIFALNQQVLSGENWFISTQRQQTLRQLYTFNSAGSFNHNINGYSTFNFTRIYGTFTDGTNWYPLPYVDVTDATNQVNVFVTPTQITITAGGGTPPAITFGFVVLEYLAQP